MVAATHPRLYLALVLSIRSICFFSAVVAATFRHIDFAPDDWLNVALAGFIEKVRSGEEITVIRDGYRGHFLPRRLIKQLGRFARPVEQTKICVNVKVDKLRLTHGYRF
jgi:hypothetical protein